MGQASIQKVPCSVLKEQNRAKYDLSILSDNNAQPADCCCEGGLTNTNPNGCGATFNSATDHKKRNAANKKDGGLYAAQQFMLQHYRSLYNCPAECLIRTQN